LVAVQIATDAKAKISERARFLACAFRAACDRARKRNWIISKPETRLVLCVLVMFFAVGSLVLSVLFIFAP
jgi:hypothetical protein